MLTRFNCEIIVVDLFVIAKILLEIYKQPTRVHLHNGRASGGLPQGTRDQRPEESVAPWRNIPRAGDWVVKLLCLNFFLSGRVKDTPCQGLLLPSILSFSPRKRSLISFGPRPRWKANSTQAHKQLFPSVRNGKRHASKNQWVGVVGMPSKRRTDSWHGPLLSFLLSSFLPTRTWAWWQEF